MSGDSGVGVPAPDDEDDGLMDQDGDFCIFSNPVTDDERGIIETLLAHAPLTGAEADDLQEMLDDDDLVTRRYQEIYNSHLATIHAHDGE